MANEIADPIVDRLKAEGQLTRNTGTNSIRSVKIQLDRFESIFNVISENITAQTEMMAKSLDMELDRFKISQETAEREKAKEQIEELNRDQEQENDKESKEKEKSEKEKEGLFSLLGGLGLKNLLMGGALLGGGLFAAYNFAKGFVDERTGGGWTRFEDGLFGMFEEIDFETLQANFSSIAVSLGSIARMLEQLAGVVSNILENPLALFGLGAFTAGRFAGRMGSGLGPRRGGVGGIPGRLSRIPFNLLGAVSLLAIAYGDEAKEYLEEQAGIPGGVADVSVDVATASIMGAVTLGSMFGPGGYLVGAVGGAAIALGIEAYNWFERNRAEAEAQLQRDLAEADRLLQNPEARSELENLAETLSTMSPEEQEAAIAERGGLTRAEQLAFEQASTPEDWDREEITYLLGEIRRMNDMGTRVDPIFIDDLRELGYDMANLLRDTGYETEEAQAAREARAAEIESLQERVNQMDSILRSMEGENLNVSPENQAEYDRLLEEFTSTNARLHSLRGGPGVDISFRRGTRGFQDFGDGTFSILHGREAVVPANTAAGRFLEQFFNDDWTPRVSQANNMSERVATATAGGVLNMPVIINNSPVNAPTINNVQGAPSLSSVNYFSGGGGGSQSGVYGLPRAMN